MSSFCRQTENFTMVTSMRQLEELAGLLCRESEFALDLEMDSLHHHREKVCLLQISTKQQSWLIDPLSLASIVPLGEPLANPEIVLVMHGSDYDIRSLHRDFGIEVSNIFDTMIASRFLGVAECGLAALLKARFAIELDKKYQKADWSKRPLTPEMCAYAVADTSYLIPLYQQLRSELENVGRTDWVNEECRLLCQARVVEKEGPLFMYCKGAGRLKGVALAVLEELLQIRDRQAEELDRPAFKVLSAETLIEAAEAQPRSIYELSRIKGMTSGQLHRYGEMILSAIEKGMTTPESERPRFPRSQKKEITDQTRERLKKLKDWRESRSVELALDPGVLAPNWLLEAVAERELVTLESLGGVAGMREWQKSLYGQEISTLLSGI